MTSQAVATRVPCRCPWMLQPPPPLLRQRPGPRSVAGAGAEGGRGRFCIRRASSKPGESRRVLEKPAKFNPPSHGSRLRKGAGGSSPHIPRHYGPALGAEEKAQQSRRHYPGLMAPKGTWAHWVWHSKLLHTCITMGTLLAMAIFTFFMNYSRNSPFKDLVPPISDLWHSPLAFASAWKNVIVLHEQDKSARARDHRFAGLDDAAKRRYYMKMHGIEPKNPVHAVFGAPEESEAELEARALGTEPPPREGVAEEKKPRRKWFGIF